LEAAARTPGSGVLAYDEDTADLVSIGARSAPLGARGDLRTVAHRLYAAMRELDRTGVTLILARTVDDAGLGSAINDRLQRAAATLVDLG
jgi:L-threonylcarbamoyladenylate synthase